MKNQKVQFITTLIVCVLVSSLVSVAATGNLFDSNEVTYDNTSSGMNSTNVKAALDELYAAATDYSDIDNRLSSLEGHFSNNNGIYFGNAIELSGASNSGIGGYIDFHYNGSQSDYTSRIIEGTNGRLTARVSDGFSVQETNGYNSYVTLLPTQTGTQIVTNLNGTSGAGNLNLVAGKVYINGNEIHVPTTNTVETTIDLVQNSWKFKHISNISIPAGKHLYGANVRITDTIVAGAACIADTFGEGQIFVGCYSTQAKSSVPITVDYLIY